MGDNIDLTDPLNPKKNDLMDPSLGLTREDYRQVTDIDALTKAGEEGIEPPIPELAEILASPRPPKIGDTQLVSVAVTDDVPLKDVFIELARLANIDIEVDAGITGGISFRAKDRPFNEVIERIADLANLRYTMKNNVLRIERDTPFIRTYPLDFLNIERSATNSISINTSVLSASGTEGGGGGGSLNTGSRSSITTTATSDFWRQFEEGVKKILSYQPPVRVSSTTVAVQPSVPQLPPSVSPEATAEGALEGGAESGGAPAADRPAPATTAVESTIATTDQPFYILNKQASTLTVSASERQHDLLAEFVRRVRTSAFSQVIIEVKIVEVTLNDQFQSGINWANLGGSKIGLTANFDQTTTPSVGTPNVATFNFSYENIGGVGIDLDSAVKLAETFGTTRTLSSPRLHAINNQEAVLTFAENQVYYDVEVDQTEATGTGSSTATTITVNSTAHTIPIGIILAMQPSINLETSEVTLNIRPTLSRVSGFVSDPAVAFILAQLLAANPSFDTTGLSSQVPIVEVRELDSILKLKSGQVMVIGGLMQDVGAHLDQGIPGVSSIPWFGNLFKGSNKQREVSELVIFIRATIVDSGGDGDAADRGVYKKFTKDPRPLKF